MVYYADFYNVNRMGVFTSKFYLYKYIPSHSILNKVRREMRDSFPILRLEYYFEINTKLNIIKISPDPTRTPVHSLHLLE